MVTVQYIAIVFTTIFSKIKVELAATQTNRGSRSNYTLWTDNLRYWYELAIRINNEYLDLPRSGETRGTSGVVGHGFLEENN